jgi:predicted NAD/FAD-dependent oxidoreductase
MPGDLPDYYYRIRDNGAAVFRVDTDNRNRRIEMEQIAIANTRNGEIRPHGDRKLSEADIAAIRDWLAARLEIIARREVDDILRTIDHLNLTTQWAQSRATDDQLDAVTDPLLLAMHDLRSMLVRRKSERIAGQEPGDEAS